MNRVKQCLSKMQELINSPGDKELIDVELMLDYTKVMYAELLEVKSNLSNNQFSKQAIEDYKNDRTKISEEKPPTENKTNTNTRKVSEETTTSIPKQEEIVPKEELSASSNGTSGGMKVIVDDSLEMEAPSNFAGIDVETTRLVDLRKLISLNDKFAYVIELFNGENEAYEDSINYLNTVSNYGNAMEWVIANLQNRFNWDVENDLVQSFYSAVKSRFTA